MIKVPLLNKEPKKMSKKQCRRRLWEENKFQLSLKSPLFYVQHEIFRCWRIENWILMEFIVDSLALKTSSSYFPQVPTYNQDNACWRHHLFLPIFYTAMKFYAPHLCLPDSTAQDIEHHENSYMGLLEVHWSFKEREIKREMIFLQYWRFPEVRTVCFTLYTSDYTFPLWSSSENNNSI